MERVIGILGREQDQGMPWAAAVLAVVLSLSVLTWQPGSVLAVIAGVVSIAAVFRAPRAGLLLWLVTTPILSFWVVIPLGAGVPDVTYNRVFVASMLAVILLRAVLGLGPGLRAGKIEWTMVLFVTLAGISLWKSQRLTTDLQLLLDAYIVPFLIFWIARTLYAESGSLRAVVGTLIVLGVSLAATGFLQRLGGRVPLTPVGFQPIHLDRMTGVFDNAAEFGGVLAMIACVCLSFASASRSYASRLGLLAAATLLGVTAVLSMTRAVWLGMLVGVIIIAWRSSLARRLLGWSAVPAFVVGIVVLPAIIGDLFAPNTMRERAGEIGPVYNRVIATTTALRMWTDKPLFGYGFGRYVYLENHREYLRPVGSIAAELGARVDVPHNEFLHLLVLTGAVGLAVYLFIIYQAARVARRWQILPPGPARGLALGFSGSMAVYLINGLFADLVFFWFHSALFYFLLGTLMGVRDRRLAAGAVGPN